MKNFLKSSHAAILCGLFLFISTQTVGNGLTILCDSESDTEIAGGAYATFGGKFGGDITSKDLMFNSEVGVAGCAAGSLIYKFSLHVNSDGKSKVFKGTSHVLTDEMLKSMRSLKQGGTFEFKDIKAHLPSGSDIDVLGRTFIVV
ncbi:MAG: hypothetical protein IIB82_02615 [Bacteroidetes bacterium]|nr:hypothetical protein [Bacteroidota bacterium]